MLVFRAAFAHLDLMVLVMFGSLYNYMRNYQHMFMYTYSLSRSPAKQSKAKQGNTMKYDFDPGWWMEHYKMFTITNSCSVGWTKVSWTCLKGIQEFRHLYGAYAMHLFVWPYRTSSKILAGWYRLFSFQLKCRTKSNTWHLNGREIWPRTVDTNTQTLLSSTSPENRWMHQTKTTAELE